MIRRLFTLLFSLVLITLLIGSYFILQEWKKSINQTLSLDAPLEYAIKSGSSLTFVLNDLESKKLIENARWIIWKAKYDKKTKGIKAGVYQLKPGMNIDDVLTLFISGKTVNYSFTIVEGWTLNQLLSAIEQSSLFKHTIKDVPLIDFFRQAGFKESNLEGMFLPETYYFPAETSDIKFLKRAYSDMQKVLNEEWDKREPEIPLKTPYEALILASIIEKETGQIAERERISGVFTRRLIKKMRLQTDPTVIYGMGESYDGNIRRRDLTTKTPYNTYVIKGLPPTPIALPGKAAIKAALHPDNGKDLYFVARGDGSHQFSETLDAHNKAVRKYQLKSR